MPKPPTITPAEADLAYAAAQKVVEMHHRLSDFLRPGQTLAQIDTFVGRSLEEMGCRSCFQGYTVPRSPPFPSHACLSVNECVVHGTAGYYTAPMKQGDLLKIDIGVRYKGWIGDAAWTYSFGKPSPVVQRLMQCGKDSIQKGIRTLRPGNTFLDWAVTVQKCVEQDYGFKLVRGLGGHGYGRKMHAAPFISNIVPAFRGEWPDGSLPCTPGTLVAVEPMIGVSSGDVYQKPGSGRLQEWPVFIADGSLSVHYEHDILITEDEPRILTEGLEGVRDVIPV